MFGYRPLPRTLAAAERDSLDAKRDLVKIEAVRELGRYARSTPADEEAAPGYQEAQERAAQLLMERLSHPVPAVRGEAALALADAEVTSAVPALLKAATDENLRVRQMVLVALGELAPAGDRAVMKLLSAAARAEEPALHYQALIGLAHVAPDDDTPLARGLADDDPELRYIALRLAEERYGVGEMSDAFLKRARRALEDPELEVRVAAAHWLGRRGEPKALKEVTRVLNAAGIKLSAEDEIALVELAGQRELSAALPGLKRRAFAWWRGPARWHAQVALARLGDSRAQETLLCALSAWSFDARTEAVAAAGQARLQAARPKLEAMRARKLAEPSALEEALAALDAAHGEPR